MSVWLMVEDYVNRGEEFIPINAVLRSTGLPCLPTPNQPDTYWTQEIGGAGCFCFLRRIAAYAAADRDLPKPILDFEEVWEDPVFQQYYRSYPVTQNGAQSETPEPLETTEGSVPLPAIGRVASPFAHLMHHQADQGYYLPIPFSDVIVTYEAIHGWCEPIGIGSANSLQDECLQLARHLGFPLDLELEEMEKLARRAPDLADSAGWERFAFESFLCKALLTGAEIAIRTGCVLSFG